MSLKPEDAEIQSPTPWSTKAPWSPARKNPSDIALSSSPNANVAEVSAHHSLSAAVRARRDEYVRKKSIKISIGTWNVAAISGTEKDLGAWFVEGLGVKGLSQNLAGLSIESSQDLTRNEHVESVQDQEAHFKKKKVTLPKDDIPALPHGEEVGLYVLGLQEVIDVASVTEAMKPFTDPNPAKKWKEALRKSLPPGYEKVAEQQLLGLLILVFASSEIAPTINSVSCTHVGTGLMGYMGNKGAVSVRLVLGETTKLCFVNCHLAAGADQAALTRRIWDTQQILNKTKFGPITYDGEVIEGSEEQIGDEDFGFWFGDLNYRLDDVPGEDVRRLLLLHTRNEYDVLNKSRRKIDSELGFILPSSEEDVSTVHYEFNDIEEPASESTAEPTLDPQSDPASLHTTLKSLLAHDQLKAQQRNKKAFHEGWREGDINFLPTYKYDIGSVGMFDSGEKKRSPSWCDRILFRTRRDRRKYEERAKLEAESLKKDEEMKKKGLDQEAADQDVLFNYDPDVDGMAYGDDYDEEEDAVHDAELVQTQDGFEDDIELNHYVSHQRVLSSDHKPLSAIFTLTYDAVIPELKAKVHQEVARELDKAENEGRPNMTVVVDNLSNGSESDADGSIEQSDMNQVQFGNVRYRIPRTRLITVANTGQISASFSFVGREGMEGGQGIIAPSWLRIHAPGAVESTGSDGTADKSLHKKCTLLPGETMTIELTVEISDPDLVYDLNQNKIQLDDVLILRVSDGRDHFVPVKGTWKPSCYCRTLDELVSAPEGGVRKIPRSPKNRDATGTNDVKSVQMHHSAPKELFALTELIPNLVERAVAEWDMTNPNTAPPWEPDEGDTTWPFDPSTWTFYSGEERDSMLAGVREALDNAKPLEEQFSAETPCIIQLEVLCETLTSFLGSLRDGIITTEMWQLITDQLSAAQRDRTTLTSEDIQAMAMEALSNAPVHSVSMTFLTFMLTRIMNEIAPTPKDQLQTLPTRRSRTSTLSSEAESEASTAPSLESTPTASSKTPSTYTNKRSFFPVLRRKRTASTPDPDSSPALEKRKALMKNYASIFSPLIIRSEQDENPKVSARDKKALENRKRRVLEAFLDISAV